MPLYPPANSGGGGVVTTDADGWVRVVGHLPYKSKVETLGDGTQKYSLVFLDGGEEIVIASVQKSNE